MLSGASSQYLHIRTSYSYSRSHVDLDGGFLGHLIAAQHLDGPIDGADDAVFVVCVGSGSVCTVQMG